MVNLWSPTSNTRVFCSAFRQFTFKHLLDYLLYVGNFLYVDEELLNVTAMELGHRELHATRQ